MREVQSVITELREAVAGGDIGRIRTLTQRLESAAHAMAASAYQGGGGQGGPGASSSGNTAPADGDEVVDAEFQEVA